MTQFLRAMRKATAATRAGDLTGAVALIQRALGARAPLARADETTTPGAQRPRTPPATQPTLPGATAVPGLSSAPLRARFRALGRLKTIDRPPPSTDPGDRYVWAAHAGPHGARRYRLFVPADAGKNAPLLLLLHGCTQTPDDFARGTRMLVAAKARGVIVALPEQTREANPMLCWNWFDPAHQTIAAGEPAILAGLVRDVMAQESVDPARVFVAGLSAGAAMAALLGEVAPDLFAAVGVHAGLAPRAARDVPSAFAAMKSGASAPARAHGFKPRLIVFHGDADTTVHPANANTLFALHAGEPHAPERRAINSRDVVIMRKGPEHGPALAEDWRIAGLGHAWSGGDPAGSHADAQGPDASAEMLRFFLETP